MSLFILSLLHPIFTSCCMGKIQLVLFNSIFLAFIYAKHFGTSLNRFLGSIQLSFGSQYYSAPLLGIIYFGVPLSLRAKNDSL